MMLWSVCFLFLTFLKQQSEILIIRTALAFWSFSCSFKERLSLCFFLPVVNEIIGRDMSQSPGTHGSPSVHNQS